MEIHKIAEATRRYKLTVNVLSSESKKHSLLVNLLTIKDERKPPARAKRKHSSVRRDPQQVQIPANWSFDEIETMSNLWKLTMNRNKLGKQIDVDKDDLSVDGKKAWMMEKKTITLMWKNQAYFKSVIESIIKRKGITSLQVSTYGKGEVKTKRGRHTTANITSNATGMSSRPTLMMETNDRPHTDYVDYIDYIDLIN